MSRYAPNMSDMNDFNQAIIEEFRSNGGKVGGGFDGAPMVLLHTTGAKSGAARINPLVCLPGDGGTLYVFASKAGAPENPDWYHNLLAHPEVEVEFGKETYAATATPVTGAERDEIYNTQKVKMPGFAEYEAKTTRTIPVVALRRARLGPHPPYQAIRQRIPKSSRP
jgi:deazaflavin-dependent oxidoreductase (nitroreductase family)